MTLYIILFIISLILIIKAYLRKTTMRTIFNHIVLGISLLVMITTTSVLTVKVIKRKEKPVIQEQVDDNTLIEEAKKEVLLEDSIYQYIKFLNIKHPELVFKQAKIESGNFKSKIFRENNNMFGMKVPYRRSNIVSGENLGYAVYNNWQESIIDYALYQTYSAKGMTKEEYIKHLGDSYAEDPNYKQKIR